MTTIDPRLGEYVTKAEYAKMVSKSERTVDRMRKGPDGLPFLQHGNEVLIPIPLAREWMASRIRMPNPTRRRR